MKNSKPPQPSPTQEISLVHSSHIHTLLNQIRGTFSAHANHAHSQSMARYMRGQFAFFGIKTPTRRALSQPFLHELTALNKQRVYALIKALWEQPERECHYLALDLYLKVMNKMLSQGDMPFIEHLILTHSWWDTVDVIAPKIIPVYFDQVPKERDQRVEEWSTSGNIWLQRSALLFQLKLKEQVELAYMFQTILNLSNTKEFFLNKAIGWLLREHSKHRPVEIRDFIDQHRHKLDKLSIREGMRHLNRR